MEHFDAYTIGFSNRSWDETVRILNTHGIECVIDIRTLPGSRRMPQFNLENLKEQLPRIGIDYVHLKSLGGLRIIPIRKRRFSSAFFLSKVPL